MSNSFYLAQFQILKHLSTDIYLALHKSTQELYTLKVLISSQKEPFISIVKLLINLQHVQHYVNSWEERGKWYIIQKWESGGDLQQIIDRKSQYYYEHEIWHIAFEIAKGIANLHKLGIIHRDLKPSNIFISKEGQHKVGDLGIAIYQRQVVKPGNTNKLSPFPFGTPYYIAPEVLRGEFYNNKLDIWSFGCLIYQLNTLTLPFQAETMKALSYNIIYKEPLPLSERTSIQMQYFIGRMLEKDPSKRAEINEVLQVISENYDRTINVLAENLKVSSIQHTKFEPSKLKDKNGDCKLKTQSSLGLYDCDSLLLHSPDMDLEESMIKNKVEVKQCDADDIKLYLTLNEKQSEKKEFTKSPLKLPRPQTAQYENQHSLKNLKKYVLDSKTTRPLTANNSKRPKTTQEAEIALFKQITNVRPNSAVALTGNQFIKNNLVSDVQRKRQLEQSKPAFLPYNPKSNTNQKLKTKTSQLEEVKIPPEHLSVNIDEFKIRRVQSSKQQDIRVHNIPYGSMISNKQLPYNLNLNPTLPPSEKSSMHQLLIDKEKRQIASDVCRKWQQRIQSAILLKK